MKEREVLDETYRKAGKLDPERFALLLHPAQTDLMKIMRESLLEGTQSTESIVVEVHKLNVYSTYESLFHWPHHPETKMLQTKGRSSSPTLILRAATKMFGSLAIVFPIPHGGGALFLRHRGHEWIFDSGRELAAVREPSIGYVAFFSDVEHEVRHVKSGHRVTLTYNLYFDKGLVFEFRRRGLGESLPPAGSV